MSVPAKANAHGAVEPSRGTLRIANVAALTGVPEPTLRAWERRYGVPAPERTASGYRLYGAKELEQVREMKRLLASGLPAAQAARVLRERRSGAERTREPKQVDPYRRSCRAILQAVGRFDDEALDRQLRALLFLGPTVSLLDHVVVPVLQEVGDRWHDGTLTVAHEHLVSQRLSTLVRDLLRLAPGWEHGAPVVLASFADDEHDLGALTICARVATWGFRPVFLGARTPPDAVATVVQMLDPQVVGLSCTVTPARARARELIDGYARACGSAFWMIGGVGAAPLTELIHARGGVLAPEDPQALWSLLHHVTSRKRRSRAPRRRAHP